EWILGSIPIPDHGGLHQHTSGWLQWVSSGALVLLIINGYRLKFITRYRDKNRNKSKTEQMQANLHTFRVEGMTCSHCKASVENGLKQNSAISEVLADPDKNMVTIEAETIEDSNIQATIEGLGYSFKGRI
ncbi:MAG: hypothetical protein DRI70_07540, partial [Bacteroidetes bacterium]